MGLSWLTYVLHFRTDPHICKADRCKKYRAGIFRSYRTVENMQDTMVELNWEVNILGGVAEEYCRGCVYVNEKTNKCK